MKATATSINNSKARTRYSLMSEALTNLRHVLNGCAALTEDQQHVLEQIRELVNSRKRLTATQASMAITLYLERPTVIPDTDVIISDEDRKVWYDKVCAAMQHAGIVTPEATKAFCDLAGVPN